MLTNTVLQLEGKVGGKEASMAPRLEVLHPPSHELGPRVAVVVGAAVLVVVV